MEDGVVTSVHADDRDWRSSFWKHPACRRDGVIMPVESRVFFDIGEASILEESDDFMCQVDVDVDLVILPVLSWNKIHLDNLGLLFGGYSDTVIEFFPVSPDEDEAFDTVGFGFLAELCTPTLSVTKSSTERSTI
jgi:hypothetical protein